jgi:hypothetical protein
VNDQNNAQQASRSYKLTSTGNGPVGSGGETLGFAKEVQIDPKAGGRVIIEGGKGTDCGLLTRQVASYRADQFLGLNGVVEERFGRNAQGQVIGVSIQADGCNIVSNSGLMRVDCSDPRIQRGLSDLEVSDFITGQTDRHAGNIFIDPATGKVTGIDNDLCFPEMGLNKLSGEAKEYVVGMPKMMHAETRDKILAVDPKEFRKMLSVPPPKPGPSPLSKAAINSAVNRLESLQRELRRPNSSIEVVQQFDKETHRRALKQQDDAFKREVNYWRSNVVAQGMHEYGQLPDPQKATLDGRIKNSYNTAPKTSYLGTVELEMAKNRIQSGNAILPEHNTIPQVQRLPQAALEKKLATAYDRMSKAERRTFDVQFEQLHKMEEQLADKQKHLQHPSLVDRLNALGKDKDALKTQKWQNAQTLAEDIDKMKASLENMADKKLGIAPQQQQQVGQGISSSKSQSVL